MPKDSLIKTNPYLKNPAQREAALSLTVESSTAIEGVRIAGLKRKPSMTVETWHLPFDSHPT